MSKELTFSEVSGHKTKRDLFLIIHDKVYDASKFIDEHPYDSSATTQKTEWAGKLLMERFYKLQWR